jgi:hypothetical protein
MPDLEPESVCSYTKAYLNDNGNDNICERICKNKIKQKQKQSEHSKNCWGEKKFLSFQTLFFYSCF